MTPAAQAADASQGQDLAGEQEDLLAVDETRPVRVLIAEDEALIRLDLKEMLTEEGFEVVAEVADGAAAVERARELRPDLAILDIKMPVMDGLEAAERITDERLAPVLILTAFSQRDLIEKARRAGAMAYLVKPFQKHDLLPAIEIAAGRFADLQGLASQVGTLQERLEARKLIERAKGILQQRDGISEQEAFRVLQRQAMSDRVSMREVAESVIAGDEAVSG